MAKDCNFDFSLFMSEMTHIDKMIQWLDLLDSDYDPDGRRRSELLQRAGALMDECEEWLESESQDYPSCCSSLD